jgi:hypothetical protein
MAKSKGELLLELAMAVARDIVAIKKPYDRRDFADLPETQQSRVEGAEMAVYTDVTSVVSYTGNPAVKESLDALDVKIGDKELIDEPLASLMALAQAYSESGLASDEVTAKRMADAYKNSVASNQRQRNSNRGG